MIEQSVIANVGSFDGILDGYQIKIVGVASTKTPVG